MPIIKCRGLIIKDWKVFLTIPVKAFEPFYCLAWGKLDEGETTLECMKREIIEELWVEPKIWNLVYVNEFKAGDRVVLDFWYLIENADDYENINLSKTSHGEEELVEYGFYDLDNLKYPAKPDSLKDIIDELKANGNSFVQRKWE